MTETKKSETIATALKVAAKKALMIDPLDALALADVSKNGASRYVGEIALIFDPLKVPRFALPSLGDIDADPFIRHRNNELIINESTRTWQAVKSRLELDVDADLSDLIAEGET